MLFSAGLLALSISSSLIAYILIFGLKMALSNALVGSMCSSAVISRWFTVSRGKALGIAAAGTSVGSLIVPPLVNGWLVDEGWHAALHNLSLVVLLVMLPVIVVCVRGRPANIGLQPEANPEQNGSKVQSRDQLMTMWDILRMPAFWLIGLSLGLMFSAYTAILTNLAPYATELGKTEVQASKLIMAVAISGFAGKIIFDIAADRLSHKLALWLRSF